MQTAYPPSSRRPQATDSLPLDAMPLSKLGNILYNLHSLELPPFFQGTTSDLIAGGNSYKNPTHQAQTSTRIIGAAEISNVIHRQMRALAAKVGNMLDIDACPPAIQEDFQRLHIIWEGYRTANSTATAQESEKNNGTHPFSQELNILCPRLLKALRQLPEVPIKIGDQRLLVKNEMGKQTLAVNLLRLRFISKSIYDENFIPIKMREKLGLDKLFAENGQLLLTRTVNKLQAASGSTVPIADIPREALKETILRNTNYLIALHHSCQRFIHSNQQDRNCFVELLAAVGKTLNDLSPTRDLTEATYMAYCASPKLQEKVASVDSSQDFAECMQQLQANPNAQNLAMFKEALREARLDTDVYAPALYDFALSECERHVNVLEQAIAAGNHFAKNTALSHLAKVTMQPQPPKTGHCPFGFG